MTDTANDEAMGTREPEDKDAQHDDVQATQVLGPATTEDVAAFDCVLFLASTAGVECADLCHRVEAAFRVETTESRRRMLRFLFHVLSLCIRPGDKESGPLVAPFRGLEAKALRPSELETFDVLLAVPDLHPDVRARLLDLSFVVKRQPRSSWFLAPTAYLEAARFIERCGRREGLALRLERAAGLARVFKQPECEREVANYVNDLLSRADSDLPEPEHLALTRLARGFNDADVHALASRCEVWAGRCVSNPNIAFTRAIWTTAAETYAMDTQLVVDQRRARLAAAETYVAEADQAQGSPHMRYTREAQALERAIQALRKIDGTRERRDELHRRMLEVQKQVPNEYTRIEGPSVDLTELVTCSVHEVSNKSFTDAVFSLITMTWPPLRQGARQHVMSEAQQNMFAVSLPAYMTDGLGRVVKKTEGLDIDKASDEDPGMVDAMHDHARRQREFVATGQLDPARRQVTAEHSPTVLDVFELVRASPFIPDGRETSFTFGLHAGFHGNWSLVAQVLVPQVENAIREIVRARGGTVSTLTDTGLQKWTLLTPLLDSAEALDAFGEDYLFALRGLLSEEGSNLRNLVSHGISSDSQLATTEMLYFWWLVLHLCMIPKLTAGTTRRSATEETAQ